MSILRAEGLQAVCCVPLIHRDRTFGTLNLASRRLDAFTRADVELLQPVGAQIAIAVENALAFKEIDALKDKLAVEKLYLEEEIRSEINFEEIVGESAALKRALGQVELAASRAHWRASHLKTHAAPAFVAISHWFLAAHVGL